jgi:hypothetical protein
MRALVVYESIFGNTQRIAGAITDGLIGHTIVRHVEVGDAPARLDPDIDLLVIGGPTHAWSMSRPRTREAGAQQASNAPVSTGIGIREWVAHLPPATRADLAVAVFDTRFDRPRWVTGSAAAAAARLLRKRGYRVVARESFAVLGTSGPLGPDEIERARQWGVRLTRLSAAVHR